MAREFARRLYKSKEWQRVREYIYTKAYGLCEKCGRPGEEVHHKIHLNPNNINDIDIALGEENLILLCRNCHFEEHRATNPLNKNFKKEKENQKYFFDEQGNLIYREE